MGGAGSDKCRPVLSAARPDLQTAGDGNRRSGLSASRGLLVPRAVVEVRVVVGHLGAVQPVDGNAGARGGGVVNGIDRFGAADQPEGVAVGLDVRMAGRGGGLHEGVVVGDVRGGGVAGGGGEEQQPEGVVSVQAGGDEGPVGGDLGFGGDDGRGDDDGVGHGGRCEGEAAVASGVFGGVGEELHGDCLTRCDCGGGKQRHRDGPARVARRCSLLVAANTVQ